VARSNDTKRVQERRHTPHTKIGETTKMDLDERINKARDDLNRTQCRRKLEQTNHVNVVNVYQKRIHLLEKLLAQAFRNPRVHVYIDEIRSDNEQTPYVAQRQAIMCSILHQLQVISGQIALMETQHEENYEIMMQSVHDIDNDWATRTNKLSQEIADATEEVSLLEFLLNENKNIASKTGSMSDNDESDIDCASTHCEAQTCGEMELPQSGEGKIPEKKDEWMAQLQRSLPGLSSLFDLRLRPKDSQLHKLMAESA
jgi:hypothetical protein